MTSPSSAPPTGRGFLRKLETKPASYLGGESSFRDHCIACVNSYWFHTCVDYCMRAPRLGAKVSGTGTIQGERRMGDGAEATPGHWGAPGWPLRQKPVLASYPRGYEQLATHRNVRRMAQRSAKNNVGMASNDDVSVLLLHSGPGDPGHAEIARVCKYALCYGRKGVGSPKIQRQIRRAPPSGSMRGAMPKLSARSS